MRYSHFHDLGGKDQPKGIYPCLSFAVASKDGGFYAEDFLAVFAATPDDVNTTDVQYGIGKLAFLTLD
ncbi:hypothetical protein N7522_013211 [Penicillium canescens]|nr:hypothetical protein N7522_013211 [Penicillium canescens]KAJ6026363.1 hypothetical protein N7444_014042 [Penicillium canescens]